MRKALSILSLIAGILAISAGGVIWYGSGMPTNNLLPTINQFGTNPVHSIYLGIILLAYGLIESAMAKGNKA